MKTLFLLIMLTQNGAGDINASFVNTESLQLCQQKALMLESVFKAAKIPLIENHCIKSDIQFTAFDHASNVSKTRTFYLLTFDKETVQITDMPDWYACMDQQKNKSKLGRVYCSSSVQIMTEL